MEEKKRIIIVGDDAVLRDVLAEKLEKNGYIVDHAEDGVVAMEKIRAIKPDCILLDILMPRMGGIEVMEGLHADMSLKSIPVIVISNSGQPVEIKRAQELGAREILINTVFDPNEVLDKVNRVLAEDDLAEQGKLNIIQNMASQETVERPGYIAEDVSVDALANNKTTSEVAPIVASGKTFVLVIEDDKFLRELLVRKLANEGYDVENAIDAETAFTILGKRVPDIILCDLILPGIDGFEILGRIKADPRTANVPVIILSNLGQKEDLDKAMGLGAKDFMVKANFTLDEILEKVRSIM